MSTTTKPFSLVLAVKKKTRGIQQKMQPTKRKTTPKPQTQKQEPPTSSPVTVDRRGEYSCNCKWEIHNYPELKAKSLHSPYFEVGGFDFGLLIYPKGGVASLPCHISLYLQIKNPRSRSKLDCFASFKLTIVNHVKQSKSLYREYCHRFSPKMKSMGWSDFTLSKTVLDPNAGFLNNGSLLISVDICVLNETTAFLVDDKQVESSSSGYASAVLNGKFTWKIKNCSLFKGMIKTQKIISPGFRVGHLSLLVSLNTNMVKGIEYLGLFLEVKDMEKFINFSSGGGGVSSSSSTTCWCVFKISVLNQKPELNHMHRESYGRFGWVCTGGVNKLGWTEYMKMSDFIGPDKGFLADDTVVFSVMFNAIKESYMVIRGVGLPAVKSSCVVKKSDKYMGKFIWEIENFARLKDQMKRKKMTGLCVTSNRFYICDQEFRILVYPRGLSQKPCHLSMFLEVLDPRNSAGEWSCFVRYQLSVLNQKNAKKSILKEAQDRCSKATKDWGWSEFMTLTSLFDQDSGYIVTEGAVFAAEVCILKETFVMRDITELRDKAIHIDKDRKSQSITWKMENFLSFMEPIPTQKIFSTPFKVGGCELRIGVYVSVDTVCAYLECDPSVVSDPDKNLWVSYRMAVVNQKDPAKTLWRESSLCMNTCKNSDLQFMKLSDMLEANSGFVVHEMVIFGCEILDYCPSFEFSELEVLAGVSTDIYRLTDDETGKVLTGNEENILRELLAAAGCDLNNEDNPLQPPVTLKECLMNVGTTAGFLVGVRLYCDDPVKVNHLLCQPGFSGSNGGKLVSKADEPLPNLENLMKGFNFLQQTIDDLLLDIMIECCQPLKGRSTEVSYDGSSEPLLDSSGAGCESESPREIGPENFIQSLIYEELHTQFDNSTVTCAVSSDARRSDTPNKVIFGQSVFPPETSAGVKQDFKAIGAFKTKWPEPSVELLGLILDSLKVLNGPISQGHPEPGRGPQSAEKISILLDKAPKEQLPDLVKLLPKLVNHSEHPFVACALLDQLQSPDAEPTLLPPILAVISQLHFCSKVWERALSQASEILRISNDEALEATICFLFKAASQCQRIPQAVKAVRETLESLGAEVSPSALDLLSKTVNSRVEIANAMLREIDSVFALDEKCLQNLDGPSLYGENGFATKSLDSVAELPCADRHFSNIFFLIDMMAIPSLVIEASQVFERGIAHGFIMDHSVAIVLERCWAQRIRVDSVSSAEKFQQKGISGKGNMNSLCVEEVFTLLLRLAETLSLSRNSRVHGFVKMFYALLFRLFADESYRNRMLRGLVGCATSPSDNCYQIYMDILVFLIHGEDGVATAILGMMRDASELANADCASLLHRLCASEDEIIHTRDAMQAELSNMVGEKAILLEKLSNSEAALLCYKSEMRLEKDRFAWEKKELSEQIQAIENQFKQFCSVRDDEIRKISKEKKVCQDRLYDVETQLSQLKSQKRDGLQKAVKEKNVLSKRLKVAEAERKRFDSELKRYHTELVAKEKVRQTLLDEVRQLKQEVKQIKGEKREKEEEVACHKAYTEGLEANLIACQQHIQSLQVSLEEEMLQHAPLYGVGLKSLSLKELEILSHIHEDGLRDIHALRQQVSSPFGDPILSVNTLQNFDGMHPTTPPVADGPSNSDIPNGSQMHKSGLNIGTAAQCFNHKQRF